AINLGFGPRLLVATAPVMRFQSLNKHVIVEALRLVIHAGDNDESTIFLVLVDGKTVGHVQFILAGKLYSMVTEFMETLYLRFNTQFSAFLGRDIMLLNALVPFFHNIEDDLVQCVQPLAHQPTLKRVKISDQTNQVSLLGCALFSKSSSRHYSWLLVSQLKTPR